MMEENLIAPFETLARVGICGLPDSDTNNTTCSEGWQATPLPLRGMRIRTERNARDNCRHWANRIGGTASSNTQLRRLISSSRATSLGIP
jgi:hypothetical protein